MAERQVERRTLFREAGLTVFSRSTYAASSVSEICSTAGLSRRQFYELYSAREDLLVDIYDDIQQRAHIAVTEALTESEEVQPQDLIDGAVGAYCRAVADDIRCARVAFVEVVGVSAELEARRAQVREQWAQVIEATAGLLPGTRTPPGGWKIAAPAYLGAVNAAAHEWSQEDPRSPLEDLIAVLSTLLFALALPGALR
ncbi:TetR/AcrR family transcriptional regulator [Nocardia nova]|uniref:TetR/AcrR family transcriptional regulator n=1 Tax=Nocardia nova TaxID=37330 RepID=UPI003402E247